MNTPSVDALRAEHIARLLQQFHAAFLFLNQSIGYGRESETVQQILDSLPSSNFSGGAVFGFTALAIVYAYDSVAKPLSFPVAITQAVDLTRLGITNNVPAKDGAGSPTENDNESAFRHLRNCFAHGRYSTAVIGTVTMVHMEDENESGTKKFEAECDAFVLADIAQKILIAAHSELQSLIPASAKVSV